MTCKCVCTCPPEVGDRIQYKLNPESRLPNVRYNGGLDLTLMYLSEFNAIYRWEGKSNSSRSGYKPPYGEVHLTREEFDHNIERVPG